MTPQFVIAELHSFRGTTRPLRVIPGRRGHPSPSFRGALTAEPGIQTQAPCQLLIPGPALTEPSRNEQAHDNDDGPVTASPERSTHDRKTFLLVHGAWHGGWAWVRVADRLRARGHRVFTPTLTGLGERAHLLHPGIDLSLHVADVLGVIKCERLTDFVLVGHSYGGCVISGVAEAVPDAIRSIVFLDAFIPDNSDATVDLVQPAVQEIIRARRGTRRDNHAGARCRRVQRQ